MACQNPVSPLSRRSFLGGSAMAAGAGLLSLTALGGLRARVARASDGHRRRGHGFGPLAPVAPSNPNDIAAAGFSHLATFPILALSRGFEHRAFSFIGAPCPTATPWR